MAQTFISSLEHPKSQDMSCLTTDDLPLCKAKLSRLPIFLGLEAGVFFAMVDGFASALKSALCASSICGAGAHREIKKPCSACSL